MSSIFFSGVAESNFKDSTITLIRANIKQVSGDISHKLYWNTFVLPVLSYKSGIQTTQYELSRPFKVVHGDLYPIYVFLHLEDNIKKSGFVILENINFEISNIISKYTDRTIETYNKIICEIKNSKKITEYCLEYKKFNIWAESEYQVDFIIEYNGNILSLKYCFSISAEEVKKLENNINNVIYTYVNQFFGYAPVAPYIVYKSYCKN